jgi:hypothetical protein
MSKAGRIKTFQVTGRSPGNGGSIATVESAGRCVSVGFGAMMRAQQSTD